MIVRRAIIATASLLSGVGAAQGQSPTQELPYEAAVSDWSRVLARFVDEEGRIDFRGLADDRADLDRFVEYISRVSPATQPDEFDEPAKVLSYHINAYNALAMHGVIETGIPAGFTSFFNRVRFFWFRKVVIGGGDSSLYNYENKVIRPLGEPRVHFALNCMVRDCPRLPREPFRADKLDSQLEAAAREFFSKQRHIRVDAEKREVRLSEILDFYTEDFVADGRRQSLISYVNQYLSTPISEDYQVQFIPYDWTTNQQSAGAAF
jgi:hypothetical protein